MGSCSSVHKSKKPPIALSPHREKPLNGENTVKVLGSSFSMRSSFAGNKDETFFDSRAWLDSDCEDDFFSVNGDFTPSRGSTPYNHPTTLSGANSHKYLTDSNSEPSPTGRKKLSDLFQETPQPITSNEKPKSKGEEDFLNQTNSEQPLDKAYSVSNSELATPTSDFKNKKKEGGKTAQCCLPSFGQSFSFSERRQKSPVKCSA